MLIAHPDDQKEALDYDEYAIAIYTKNEDVYEELSGHIPVELSSLFITSFSLVMKTV